MGLLTDSVCRPAKLKDALHVFRVIDGVEIKFYWIFLVGFLIRANGIVIIMFPPHKPYLYYSESSLAAPYFHDLWLVLRPDCLHLESPF